MMTAEEKVTVLHEKMAKRRQKREVQKTVVIGVASAVLAVNLILLAFSAGIAHGINAVNTYSGTLMLFDNVGAYVLIAIATFSAAVIITTLCMRYKRKKENPSNNQTNEGYSDEKQ